MFVNLKKGTYRLKNLDALVPPCAVLKYWLEKALTSGRANSKQNGDRKTSNEISLPTWCNCCILEEVLRTRYSVHKTTL